jgi:hypothetical protein
MKKHRGRTRYSGPSKKLSPYVADYTCLLYDQTERSTSLSRTTCQLTTFAWTPYRFLLIRVDMCKKASYCKEFLQLASYYWRSPNYCSESTCVRRTQRSLTEQRKRRIHIRAYLYTFPLFKMHLFHTF